jgi:hypothetical protein
MTYPEVTDEEGDVQIGEVVVNALGKQTQTADKWWASSLDVGCISCNLSP